MRTKKRSEKTKRYLKKKNSCNYRGAVLGSMHQGNSVLLPAAGRQCVANVLTYFLFTKVKTPSTYTADDIDNILYQGSSLYNQIIAHLQIANNFLLISELPTEVNVNRSLFLVSSRADDACFGLVFNEQPINPPFYTVENAFTHLLAEQKYIFCTLASYQGNSSGSTIGVYRCNDIFYVFDPHSRNEVGMLVADGQSVLLTFALLPKLIEYVRSLAKSMNLVDCTFEITPCDFDIGSVVHQPSMLSSVYNVTFDVPTPETNPPDVLPDGNCGNGNVKPIVCNTTDSTINLQSIVKRYKETKSGYMKRKRSEELYCQSEKDRNSKRYKVMKSDTDLLEKRREADRKSRQSKRSNLSKKQSEQALNTVIRKEKRTDPKVRHMEQVKDTKHRQMRRMNPVIRQTEQTSNSKLRKEKRTAPKIRQFEQTSNSRLRKEKRTDPKIRQRDNRNNRLIRNQVSGRNPEIEISNFHNLVSEGPTYVCISCDQLCYKRSVVNKSNTKLDSIINVKQNRSTTETQWVCHTCMRYLKKNKMPPCAIANGNNFPKIPDLLSNLYPLELRLISPRLPFMQIRQAPRGKQFKLTGNVVNVPANVNLTVATLPRPINEEGTIKVQLKRKLSYVHHVEAANVRPEKVIMAAKWLTENGTLYKTENISVNTDWNTTQSNKSSTEINTFTGNLEQCDAEVNSIAEHLCNEHLIAEQLDVAQLDNEHTTTEQNDNQHYNAGQLDSELANGGQCTNSEENVDDWTEVETSDVNPGNADTMLTARGFVEEDEYSKAINIAPGEGNYPMSVFRDKHSEELAFPGIFCGEKRIPNENRESKIYYSEICKSEIRRNDRRVCKQVDNLFFKLKKMQMKLLFDQTHIILRKYNSKNNNNLKAKDLKGEKLNELVSHNDGYKVLKKVRGTPPYFEAMQKDIFAMIRQLGPATLFLSFSAAETKWTHLLKILGKILDHRVYTDNDLSDMSWQEKCRLIQSDPVTCARHFDYQVQILINKYLLNGLQPLGKIVDYFYRVEFQHRGSPHIHMLVWLKDPPSLTTSDDATIVRFIDSLITCQQTEDDITALQSHKHSVSCKKRKKNICRFGFPKPPMTQTALLHPIEIDSDQKKFEEHQQIAKQIFTKLTKMGDGTTDTIESFLGELQITYDIYIFALRTTIKVPTIFLRRNLAEIRINNYNMLCLKAWRANMDIQYITNSYSCAVYISSYITKGQRGMSELLKAASEEAQSNSSNIREQVRAIGNKFLNNVEISAQEAVYLLLQIPLRKSSRSTIFINTSQPEERVRLLKPVSEIEKMDDDETKLHYDDKITRYKLRSSDLNNISLAEYFAYYNVKRIAIHQKYRNTLTEDGYPSEMLDDDYIVNDDDVDEENVPDVANTNNSVYKETRRKNARILRCVRYNIEKDRENFYREKIMLYTSWRNEEVDLLQGYNTYESRYNVDKETILQQQSLYEPAGNVIDNIDNNGLENDDMTSIWNNIAPNSESNNIPVHAHTNQMNANEQNSYNADIGIDIGIRPARTSDVEEFSMQTELNDSDYRELMRSVNELQHDFITDTLNKLKQKSPPQLMRFLSGGAGVGKSHAIQALYQSLIKYYNTLAGEDFHKITVLLLAPTGKAAFNIRGNTIHNALHILPNQSLSWKPMSMEKLNTYRCKYENVKVVIIDEISMVGNKLFHYIHKRLQEITTRPLPFGGISVIAVGDLFQLRPVMDNYVFQNLRDGYGPLATNLWVDHFSMFEFTEIMRQKKKEFAELLNRLREGNQTDNDIKKLQSRVIKPTSSSHYPHLFLTNAKVLEHNNLVISQYPDEIVYIASHDTVLGDVSQEIAQKIKRNLPTDPAKTMQLYSELTAAVGMIYDISANVDTEDGLANGASCILRHITRSCPVSGSKLTLKEICILWVEFDSELIAKKTRKIYEHLYKNNIDNKWTPIVPISRQFNVGKKHIEICRQQFPLRPAAAKTVHRSQGTTVENIVIDLSGRAFPHIHYVALSRVKSLEGLYIDTLNENQIKVDDKVVAEMSRLRSSRLNMSPLFRGNFTIMYINCRSLHKHINDLKSISTLKDLDIVVCSETRLQAEDDNEYNINDFNCYRFDEINNTETRPYHGMCVYHKSDIDIDILHKIRLNLTEAIIFYVHSKQKIIISIYRSPKENNLQSIDDIMTSFETQNILQDKTIIIGDLNVDWDCDRKRSALNKIMLNKFGFHQVIEDVTTQYNSKLDLIFTKNPEQYSTGIENMFFTDHKGIWINL